MSNNRIAKNTIFLYIRMGFAMIVSLYTVRVVLRVLGIEDYGVFSAVGGIISSLTIFTSALCAATQRFFSIEIGKGDIQGLNRIFNSVILLFVLTGGIILITAETVGVWFLNHKMLIPLARMETAMVILQCAIISFFISIITSPFQAIIIANEDMKIYAYVGIYDVVVKLLIVYILQFFGTDKLLLYAYLLLAASISSNFIYLIFTLKNYKDIKFCLRWDSKTIKSVLGFSSWSFIGSLAFLFNAQGINLMMNVFFGPVVNAAYNIANSVKNAVNQLGINFFTAVRPNLIKEFALGNYEYVNKLFLFSSKVVFSLLYIIILPLSIETERIILLWLGEVGDYMISFVRLMLVWTIILLISEPITVIIQAANKVKQYHLIVDMFTLLTLPISYIAFKFGFSPASAFVISILVFIIAHVIRLLILKNIINISITCYFKEIVVRILAAVLISLVGSYILTFKINSEVFFELLIKIVIYFSIAILSCYKIVFNIKERVLIKGLIVRFISKFKTSSNVV